MILGLILWIILCAFVAALAEKKGHKGVGYFLLAIFLSPLIGGIIVACLDDKNSKLCKYCQKKIPLTAKVCGYCGKELVQKKSESRSNEKEKWVSARIVELLQEGKNASDAKIQAEAEFVVKENSEEREIAPENIVTSNEKDYRFK